ncbi:phospholipase D family protein [Kribbella sp. NBC_01245]|uniref:hypothetical protein n=1 Tax=Kribbella sp. NBC_01245 TaxID=2903578 RepID=UPI002E2D690A|nr:hypothetical protein [Kribbella sp. NBC_01245]
MTAAESRFPSLGPLPWRGATKDSAIFGPGVVDDLVRGVDDHRGSSTNDYWRRLEPTPAAIGCVPYFSDRDVANALGKLGACCIVVDKRQQTDRAVRILDNIGTPISSAYLDGFEEISLPDERGRPHVIHPYGGMPDPVLLGPVRVAGWSRNESNRLLPQLHAKLLILGVTTYYENDEDFSGDIQRFHPHRVWLGSANWTHNARQHAEFGVWSTDADLMKHTYEYLLRLIEISEYLGSLTVGPTPELVPAEWDHEAFWEYVAEHSDEPDDD